MEYYPKFYYRLETMERQYIFYMTILMIFRNVRREPGLKKNGLSKRLQTEIKHYIKHCEFLESYIV